MIKTAVKKALAKQSGLTPQRQHDVFRRLKRFGVLPGTMWKQYAAQAGDAVKPEYLVVAENLACENVMLVYTSLYVHLLDQQLWELISAEEMQLAGQQLLDLLAGKYFVEKELIADPSLEEMLAAWQRLFNVIVSRRLA